MVSRILFPALFLLLSTISTSVLAESNFKAVYLATKTLIAGRVFENEDQTRLTFSSIRVKSPIEFEMSANLQFVDGESSSHKEIVTNEGTHTLQAGCKSQIYRPVPGIRRGSISCTENPSDRRQHDDVYQPGMRLSGK